MAAAYNEQVSTQTVQEKKRFDWLSLGIWVGSIFISSLPIFLSMIQYGMKQNTLDKNYWFKCFTSDDALWVCATVLLFSLVNSLIVYKRRAAKSRLLTAFYVISGVLFVFTEAIWVLFKYTATNFSWVVVVLGAILSILSLIFATPMQVNFIRNEG